MSNRIKVEHSREFDGSKINENGRGILHRIISKECDSSEATEWGRVWEGTF